MGIDTNGLRIRRAVEADHESVLELVRVSLGQGTIPRTLDYWRWKHESNPFGRSPILVAEAEGQIVALRVFMRWEWRNGGRDLPAVRAVDTATHPDWRGQGLFKRLTLQLRDELADEGTAFVYNTPNAQSRPGYLKMGWSLVGKPTLWMRPIHPSHLGKALLGEGLGGPEAEPPVLEALPAAEAFGNSGIKGIVRASAETECRAAYHTVPSLDFLRWRYAETPGFSYYVLHRGGGDEGALAIVRSRQRGSLREIRVCELLIGPDHGARINARRILRDVVQCGDIDLALALPPAWIGARRVLAASGYIPIPRSGPIMTVYPLVPSPETPDPTVLQNWRPSVGGLELL